MFDWIRNTPCNYSKRVCSHNWKRFLEIYWKVRVPRTSANLFRSTEFAIKTYSLRSIFFLVYMAVHCEETHRTPIELFLLNMIRAFDAFISFGWRSRIFNPKTLTDLLLIRKFWIFVLWRWLLMFCFLVPVSCMGLHCNLRELFSTFFEQNGIIGHESEEHDLILS